MGFKFKKIALVLSGITLGYCIGAADNKPSSDTDLINSAKILMQDNNYDKAYSILSGLGKNPEAQYMLAQMYFLGAGNVPIDPQKGVNLLFESAANGYAKSELMLGDLYEAGNNALPQDWNKAMSWYMSAASHGSNEACYALAKNYYNGMGVKQDYIKAVYWYAKAAQLGNISGMQMLGQIYLNGIGVETNVKLALAWYTKAAEAGSLDSQSLLGETYSSGILVPQDYILALKWYTMAAVGGDAAAQGMILPVCQRMRPYNAQNISVIIDSITKVKAAAQDTELKASLDTELESYKNIQSNLASGQ